MCDGKRPLSLLSELVTLVELACLRRLPPAVERWRSADHYAFPRSRSAEILLSDRNESTTLSQPTHGVTVSLTRLNYILRRRATVFPTWDT